MREWRRIVGVLCGLAGVIALSGAAVRAQDLSGAWQGTLQAGQPLRVVFTITNADSGALASPKPLAEAGLRATMHSIDQGVTGIAATVAVQGTTVRIGVTAIGGTFEGRLSADGTSIIGTWSQGGGSLPLTLVRATPDTAWALPAPPTPMATDKPAAFEVATIKPSNPAATGKLFTVKGRQVLTINTTANDLITFAYDLHERQIAGGPPWMESDRFDINGQPQGQGMPNQTQLKQMVRKLLEDRFKLAVRRETRELPVYAIVPAAAGPKLARNDSNPDGLPSLLFKGLGVLPAVNASMADFARVMQIAVLDRPVVDRTGLSGRYDFTLTWTADESQFRSMGVRVPPPSNDPNAPPGLFTAVQEQLGLRFQSANAPVDVFVIERVERPSEN